MSNASDAVVEGAPPAGETTPAPVVQGDAFIEGADGGTVSVTGPGGTGEPSLTQSAELHTTLGATASTKREVITEMTDPVMVTTPPPPPTLPPPPAPTAPAPSEKPKYSGLVLVLVLLVVVLLLFIVLSATRKRQPQFIQPYYPVQGYY